jgi:hypothetical protein
MKRIFISILLLTLGCNSDNRQLGQVSNDQNKIEQCPPEWIATGKELKQIDINDTTEQMFLNDTLWFEVIGPSAYGKNQHKAYIKNYRTNGQLEDEGFAIYFDHPISDYERHGKWKYYNCKGKQLETKEFFEGVLVDAN